MNKVASYLQEHIAGEVFDSHQMREQFSVDASMLTIKPTLVVYPRTTNDIRKIARFTWQLAEKGHVLPITARGNGTDLTGSAIGRGITLSFPAHMNRILELDSKQRLVRVQPGVNFKSLQETLFTHGLFLPPFPASYEYSTVGGAIANNTSGIKSHKYGDMRKWVDRLEVVLANGEIIQTGRLSKRDVSKKLGLATLEGELYRAVDTALKDDMSLLRDYSSRLNVDFDNVGYALESTMGKGGSLDLTPLFVGSQGTLGIITEAILKTAPHTPIETLVVASFGSLDDALLASKSFDKLKPSVCEIIDGDLLNFVTKHNNVSLPAELLSDGKLPSALLFVESDDDSLRARNKFSKQAKKVLSTLTSSFIVASDFDERERLWAIRYVTGMFMNYDVGGVSAIPAIEDVTVPVPALHQFILDTKSLCKKHHVQSAIWFNPLTANVHVLPLLDLSKLGDRQRIMKLMDAHYRAVIKLGGSIAVQSSDGRLRVPYTKLQVGDEVMGIYERMKGSIDPHGTLNPGVKVNTTIRDIISELRQDYSYYHLADFLPKM